MSSTLSNIPAGVVTTMQGCATDASFLSWETAWQAAPAGVAGMSAAMLLLRTRHEGNGVLLLLGALAGFVAGPLLWWGVWVTAWLVAFGLFALGATTLVDAIGMALMVLLLAWPVPPLMFGLAAGAWVERRLGRRWWPPQVRVDEVVTSPPSVRAARRLQAMGRPG